MFVIIGKCEKCGSPMFSKDFDQSNKVFTSTDIIRTCHCFNWETVLEQTTTPVVEPEFME